MIKVLINIPESKSWIGGLNYFINLTSAINSLHNPQIELVTFKENKHLPPPLNTLKTLADRWPPKPDNRFLTRLNRKFKRSVLKRELFTDFLMKEKIRLFSHEKNPVPSKEIKNLLWIPDFQHKYLPHFFTSEELANRDSYFSWIKDNSYPVLFSSHDALKDFNTFYAGHNCPTYVLQFATSSFSQISEEEMSQVIKALDIKEPFFYVPNQLWAHKNHSVIIEALNILKENKHCPLVISTGLTEDYRNPTFFQELKDKINQFGLSNRFIFLGLVDYQIVTTLMRKSVALINPSLFEGWSTTVEEAKSLGKKIILSDLSVHKEQAPERGLFFNPHDPQALAELMQNAFTCFNQEEESACMEKAATELPSRMQAFGKHYQDIVFDLLKLKNSR